MLRPRRRSAWWWISWSSYSGGSGGCSRAAKPSRKRHAAASIGFARPLGSSRQSALLRHGQLRLRRDNALLEHETAIEAGLASGDDAISPLGPLIKGHSLDRTHPPGFALGAIDLALHLRLD